MYPTLDPGAMRHWLYLERDNLTRVNGVESRTPEVYATVRAAAKNESGSESFQAGTVASQSNWQFTIRYRTDVKAMHRVIFNGVRMEILAINEDATYHTQMMLICRTFDTNG